MIVSIPTGWNGTSDSGHCLVESSGSKSNLRRSSGLTTWTISSHFGKSPFLIASIRSSVRVAGSLPPIILASASVLFLIPWSERKRYLT